MDDKLAIGESLVGLVTVCAILEKLPDTRITLLEKTADVSMACGHSSSTMACRMNNLRAYSESIRASRRRRFGTIGTA